MPESTSKTPEEVEEALARINRMRAQFEELRANPMKYLEELPDGRFRLRMEISHPDPKEEKKMADAVRDMLKAAAMMSGVELPEILIGDEK